MAAPSVPTSTTLCTEALKLAGYSSPSTTQLTRAAEWLEQIKNDIWLLGKRLKPLQAEYVQVLTGGIGQVDFTSDFSSIMSAEILYGDECNDVEGGAAATVTLDSSDETGGEDDIEGSEILIYSGTGINEISRCYSYDEDTYIATVSPAWGTEPVATDTYVIIDQYIDLELKSVSHRSEIEVQQLKGPPQILYQAGDEDHYGYYFLYPIPDDDYYYGIRIRYYLNLLTLDLASTRLSTLYQRWRNLWIQGVMARQLKNDDDNRAASEMALYYKMVKDVVALESTDRTAKQHYRRLRA